MAIFCINTNPVVVRRLLQQLKAAGLIEAPNENCPVGRNIHAVLDGRLRDMQVVFENEMKRTSLSDILTDTEKLIETQK